MHSSIVPSLLWSYWANIIYIIGMIGYLTIDTINYTYISFNNTLSYIIYIFLSILFVIDAVLYTIDWYIYAVKLRKSKNESIQYRSEFFACIFQNLGSYFYLIGALLLFDKNRLFKTILLFNFIGIISFLIESCLTSIGWTITFRRKPLTNPKNGCHIQNVYIWAHMLNIIGNLIYLCAIILAYNFYQTSKIMNSNSIVLIQIFGDLIYLIDAYLYLECWQRDKIEFDVNTEQQSLNNFYLEKLHYDTDTKSKEHK
ncbi:unnamed protein product [Adineta steineri]|uniref:Uncharacterized protein n=1 Tax=Adineta steineri TaxID=433720 RepID=A0A815FPQ5_9BILA|nr:unnamed protein product [Adineta steineri]CAF3565867.1 unnamed protein product [Adineta steineri]